MVHGLDNKLPDDIEHIYPDYSLYNLNNVAYGFLTRGCPRKCEFCIVSKKEGCKSEKVANLKEFYTNQKEIRVLDANILACKERELLLCELLKSGAYVDFTQGLDIRLLDDYCINLISQMKIKMLHFAWDNPNEDLTKAFVDFKEKSKVPLYKISIYVLINYNTTHEQDLYRIYKLREMGYFPYVMIYDKYNATTKQRHLQRWVNNKFIWKACNRFEDYKHIKA